MKHNFQFRLNSCLTAIKSVSKSQRQISDAAKLIATAMHRGNRIFACGNGGSAAEAMHFATELSGRFRANRIPFPAIALSSDATALTCIGNDFGWDQIFARQLYAHARAGDILLALSTSGNSKNVREALDAARRLDMKSIGLLGKGGGAALPFCDIPIVIESDDTAAIQEAHLVVIHIFCEELEPEIN